MSVDIASSQDGEEYLNGLRKIFAVQDGSQLYVGLLASWQIGSKYSNALSKNVCFHNINFVMIYI